MRILIVEDDPQVAKLLLVSMEVRGAEVKLFYTAIPARQNVEWADVILCDGTFPFQPGDPPTQAWRCIASAAVRYEKPFVLLSGDPTVCAQARRVNLVALDKGSTPMKDVWAALVKSVEDAKKVLDKPNVAS